jgi:hypothetical protein
MSPAALPGPPTCEQPLVADLLPSRLLLGGTHLSE